MEYDLILSAQDQRSLVPTPAFHAMVSGFDQDCAALAAWIEEN